MVGLESGHQSSYAEADRLTAESIQTMNDMASFADRLDLSRPSQPGIKQKMDELRKRLEASAIQLDALTLSAADRVKLGQKYNAKILTAKRRLSLAKSRMEMAFLRALKSELSGKVPENIRGSARLREEAPGK